MLRRKCLHRLRETWMQHAKQLGSSTYSPVIQLLAPNEQTTSIHPEVIDDSTKQLVYEMIIEGPTPSSAPSSDFTINDCNLCNMIGKQDFQHLDSYMKNNFKLSMENRCNGSMQQHISFSPQICQMKTMLKFFSPMPKM